MAQLRGVHEVPTFFVRQLYMGIFKQPVTSIKYESSYDLKRIATDLFESIDQETLGKIHDRTFRRMPFHMDYKGQQVGPFDKKIKLRGF